MSAQNGSTMPTKEIFYKKKMSSFLVNDWKVVAQKTGVDRSSLNAPKEKIIKMVYSKDNSIKEKVNDFFYFRTKGNILKYFAETPENSESFGEQVAATQHQVSVEKLNELFDQVDEESNDLDCTIYMNDDLEDSQINSVRNDMPYKALSRKIRYEPKQEIQRFLSQVETFGKANGIEDEKSLIAIAVAALDQTDEGSVAKETLNDMDLTYWSQFKTKLTKLLGHSPEYYRNYFSNFKRNEMRLGLALSCLTQAFKRGWGINDRPLNELEKKMIITTFINSLDGPLKVMLKSEERNLTFDSITERALELDSCLGKSEQLNALTLDPFAVQPVAINAVQPASTQMADILKLLTTQHNDMMNIMKSFTMQNQSNENYHQRNSNYRGSNRKRPGLTPEQRSALNGMCSHYVKGRSCTRANCAYKHNGVITEEARNALN